MSRRWLRDALVLAGAFVGATLLAALFGATNLGTALTFGQLAFMGAVVALILRRRRPAGAAAEPPEKGGRPASPRGAASSPARGATKRPTPTRGGRKAGRRR